MKDPRDWLAELGMLAARFPALGVGPDMAALTLAEAWALYLLLTRLAGGAHAG